MAWLEDEELDLVEVAEAIPFLPRRTDNYPQLTKRATSS
jgi:hypothetical protein